MNITKTQIEILVGVLAFLLPALGFSIHLSNRVDRIEETQREISQDIDSLSDDVGELASSFRDFVTSDEALNTKWLEADIGEHGKMFETQGEIKQTVSRTEETMNYVAKSRLARFEDLFQVVLSEIADIRVAIAECGR